MYIRGCDELPELVDKITAITMGQLGYIGEWHSHPDGASTQPSPDDQQVLQWLVGHMQVESKPASMVIVGSHLRSRIILKEVDDNVKIQLSC